MFVFVHATKVLAGGGGVNEFLTSVPDVGERKEPPLPSDRRLGGPQSSSFGLEKIKV